ncbi:hypothetical protein BD779DRAFT_1788897 [Infundibulicybe gibba]|nr:hypothetical protein BD779DRAFT_1788897 [Infundibulicybe gibba]
MVNIPAEILQTIFLELCSPTTTFPLREGEPRLVVAHVCAWWRAIALSTPTLWANLSIHVRGFRLQLAPPLLGPIRAWISRSAQSTLSFNFHDSMRDSEMVIDFVFPIIHRCSFLNLQLNTMSLNRLLTLPPNSLYALQSIALLVGENTRVADPTPFATAFQSCPELRTFALTTLDFGQLQRHPENLKIADFNVPWHQLTTLHLYSPSISAYECLDIIHKCASLQECCIYISFMGDLTLQRIIDLSRHPVALSFLHTLRIVFPYLESESFMFLRALHLPRLRKFRPELFKSPDWIVRAAPWSLSMLQSVPYEALQELDLSEFPVFDNLSEMLAQTPNLTALWLNDYSHQYPGIMRALGEGTIAPHLITLHFGLVESSDFVFDILEARVAATRANNDITAFTDVTTLDRSNNPTMINEPRLLALTETGMQVRFGCGIRRFVGGFHGPPSPNINVIPLSMWDPGTMGQARAFSV